MKVWRSGRIRSGASSARKWPQSANSCTSQSASSALQQSSSLGPEGDVLVPPQHECRLADEGRALVPDLPEPIRGADDVSRQRRVGGSLGRSGLRSAIVLHRLFSERVLVAHVARGMTPLTKKLRRLIRYCPSGPAIIELKNRKCRSRFTGQHQVLAITIRFTRSGNRWAKSRPIGPPQSVMNSVASRNVQVVHQRRERLCMRRRVMIFAAIASRGKAETDVVRRDAAELRSKLFGSSAGTRRTRPGCRARR